MAMTLSSEAMHTLIALAVLSSMLRAEFIIGNREGCSNEGETVALPIKHVNVSCFNCLCKNGFVECHKHKCIGQEGCYMLEESQKPGECCRQCKGCMHQGKYHPSGSEWRDHLNPCQVYHCMAGVVTMAEEVCYDSHCHHLVSHRGGCCKPCKGCMFNGQLVPEGREVTTSDDPCLKCRCIAGHLTCSKRACPVLQCPASKTVHIPGECCPICRGNRSLVEPQKGKCIFRTTMRDPGETTIIDQCTSCKCSNGTNVCKRQTCPVLTCPTEDQSTTPGDCCPHCPPVEESRAVCIINGKTYEDGEAWQLNSCMSCTCRKGSPRCARTMCPDSNSVCPLNQKLVHTHGECCPKCVESDGVCTVFGDPHYRTFDGKFFSFQGSCKYLLAADCVGRSFTIRVNNDARLTNTSSWTKTVALKIGDLKVNLGQNMRVKINGERVKPPFKLDGLVIIEKTNDSVLVKTAIGVKILWNGNSFLEVSAAVAYKNRLCGLCGNYNGIPRDDLRTRRGRLTNDTDKFGMSWRVGGRKACDRDHDKVNKTSKCGKEAARSYPCMFIKHKVFEDCSSKVNDHVYLRSCGVDMCECPTTTCYCESLTAYAHECQRLGVPLGDWRSFVGCPSTWSKQRDKAIPWSALNDVLKRPPHRAHSPRPPRPRMPVITRRPDSSRPRPPPPVIQ